MAWCHQATSHSLSQCWPRSMPPYAINDLFPEPLLTFINYIEIYISPKFTSKFKHFDSRRTISKHHLQNFVYFVLGPHELSDKGVMMGANMSGVTTSWNALVAKIRTTQNQQHQVGNYFLLIRYLKSLATQMFVELFSAHEISQITGNSNVCWIIFCWSDIANHWQLKCLLNSLLWRTTKKAPKVHIRILLWREPCGFFLTKGHQCRKHLYVMTSWSIYIYIVNLAVADTLMSLAPGAPFTNMD